MLPAINIFNCDQVQQGPTKVEGTKSIMIVSKNAESFNDEEDEAYRDDSQTQKNEEEEK